MVNIPQNEVSDADARLAQDSRKNALPHCLQALHAVLGLLKEGREMPAASQGLTSRCFTSLESRPALNVLLVACNPLQGIIIPAGFSLSQCCLEDKQHSTQAHIQQ